MDSVLSTEGIVRFFIAFVIVLALIGVTFWLIRRFGGARVGAAAQRGRAPRLAVIDAAAVDGRRRLVLVRRDNVEHLLMIGGPSDIVVEQNILRAVPVNAPRDMPSPRADAAPRAVEPARPQSFDEDANWQQPQPEVPARPSVSRPDLTLRPRAIEPRAAELSRTLDTPRSFDTPRSLEPRSFDQRPAAEPRAFDSIRPVSAPAPAPRAFEPPPIAPAEEHAEEDAAPPDAALANMAQRLEAALRRPGEPAAQAPVPRAAPSIQATEARIEEAFALPQTERTPTAPDAPDAPHNGDKGAKSKSVLDSLEEEMASLLGRPPEKT